MPDRKSGNGEKTIPSKSRKAFTIAFRVLVLSCSIIGISILMIDAKSLPAALSLFNYYTIQSNLLVVLAMGIGIWEAAKDREQPFLLGLFTSGVVLWILVTGIVYHMLLAGSWHPTGAVAIATQLLHTVTPLGMVLNWLVFEKKGRYQYKYAIYWLSYPFIYMIVSWVRGWLTGFFPYWFLNPTEPYPKGAGSLTGMLTTVGILSIGFYCLGILIVFLDRVMVRGKRMQNATAKSSE